MRAIVCFLVLVFACQTCLASIGPNWMTTRTAYGGHAVVFPIAAGAYPTLRLEVGDPGTRMRASMRWTMPGTLLGYVGQTRLQASSKSFSVERGHDIIQFGGNTLVVPLLFADAPPVKSSADNHDCSMPHTTRVAQPELWLDMSDNSTLWRHWKSWSIGPTRVVLGKHRPPKHRRHLEMLSNADGRLVVRVEDRYDYRLLVDFECDYTYVPHELFVSDVLNKTNGNKISICGGEKQHLCFHLHADENVIRSGPYSHDTVVIGKQHARRLLVGHSVGTGEWSIVPLDLISPALGEVDMLAWFGVLIALQCLWTLAIYPGVARTSQRWALEPFSSLRTTSKEEEVVHDTSVFSVHSGNVAIVTTLHLITIMAVFGSLAVLLFGFNLPGSINIDLPPTYTAVVVWIASVLAILSISWPPVDGRPDEVRLMIYHVSNALRITAWLWAALRYELWLMQVIMLILSGFMVVRNGEMVLTAFYSSNKTIYRSTLARRRRLWTVYFFVNWLLSAWLLVGYTLPMLIDTWWSTLLFRVEFSIAIGVVISLWLPVYIYVSEQHHLANTKLLLLSTPPAHAN